MHEEKKLVYLAGHNIIIYDLDETSNMQFIAGSSNADEINHIVLSPTGRFIAYCERANPRA